MKKGEASVLPIIKLRAVRTRQASEFGEKSGIYRVKICIQTHNLPNSK